MFEVFVVFDVFEVFEMVERLDFGGQSFRPKLDLPYDEDLSRPGSIRTRTSSRSMR